MREEEPRRTLECWSRGQVEEALQELAAGGAAQVVERHGERFWSAAGCRYPSVGIKDRGDCMGGSILANVAWGYCFHILF